MEHLLSLESGVYAGLLWAILTLGVYLTFRLLDFADLTVEGTFPLGAVVTVVFINNGMNPFLATLLAMIIGMVAGFTTGIFNTVFKIPAILSGILTMIALYSVNIRIMEQKATVTIGSNPTVKKVIMELFPQSMQTAATTKYAIYIIIGAVVCAALVVLLYAFFGTEIGAAIRATGSNPNMARSLGVNTKVMTVLGLMISNALIALSGSLMAQIDNGSATVSMGQGTIVIGLASVIIGEVLFIRKDHSFAYKLVAVILGAVIYRTVIVYAQKVKFLESTDLKLITAVIVAIALALPVIKNYIATKQARRINDRNFAKLGEGK